MKKTAGATFIILAVSVISGCSAGYSCKETIDGVKCANVARVYDDKVLGGGQSTATTVYNDRVINRKLTKAELEDARKSRNMTNSEKIVRGMESDTSRPIHIPPTILRIWTAPWEDADGDLHQPGFIYCEMGQKRGRWLFGEQSAGKEAAGMDHTRIRMPGASTQTAPGKADGSKGGNKYYGDPPNASTGRSPVGGGQSPGDKLKLSK